MGWTSIPGFRLKDLIKDLTKSQTWENGEDETIRQECLAKTVRLSNPGNGRMWAVFETRFPNGDVERFIVEFLLSYFRRDEGWAYKDIEESMGPVDVDCPLKYIEMVSGHEPMNDYSRKWRERVREYHVLRREE